MLVEYEKDFICFLYLFIVLLTTNKLIIETPLLENVGLSYNWFKTDSVTL